MHVDIKDVLDILRRQRGWVIATPLALLALSFAYAMSARPTYTAVAQVYVDPRERHTPKDDTLRDAVPGDGLLLVESQLKIITSDEVLMKVVEKVRLDSDPEFNGSNIGIIKRILTAIGVAKPIDPKLAALRSLRLKTATKRLDRSFVIDIMASAETPERAVTLANALASSYLEDQADAEARYNRRVSESISTQLEKLRLAVTQSEDEVAAYKAEKSLVGSRSGLVTEQQLAEANTQLTNAKTRLAEAQARLRLVELIRKGAAGLETLPEAVQSATIVQLRARATDLAREDAQLSSLNGPLHPALRAVQAQRRELQAAIKNEVDRIAQSVQNSADGERANVQDLQLSFNALKTQAQANEKLLVPLRQLERTAEANRTIYESFLSRAKAADQQQVIDKSNVRVITRASPPEGRSWPPAALMFAVSLLLGFFLGVSIALARDYLASRRKLQEASGVIVEDRETQLRRLVDEFGGNHLGHTVLFVYLESDAALDFFSLEVARELSLRGNDVLFIDADLTRRMASCLLRLDKRQGLTDLLSAGPETEDRAIYCEPLDLEFLPAGTAEQIDTSATARKALARTIEAARDFDNVIIDGGVLDTLPSKLGIYAHVDEITLLVPGWVRDDDVEGAIENLKGETRLRVLFLAESAVPNAREAA